MASREVHSRENFPEDDTGALADHRGGAQRWIVEDKHSLSIYYIMIINLSIITINIWFNWNIVIDLSIVNSPFTLLLMLDWCFAGYLYQYSWC